MHVFKICMYRYIGQSVYSHLENRILYYNVLRLCRLIRQTELVGYDKDSFFLALHTGVTVSLEGRF